MIRVVTGSAAENSLRHSTFGVDVSARAARLRAVRGWNFYELTSAPRELVLQHLSETAPSSVENTEREIAAGLDHVFDLELLNHDDAVAIGVAVTEDVQKVFALSTYFSVDARNAEFGFGLVLRSFLASRNYALSMCETMSSCSQISWRFDDPTVGVGNYVDHTAIDCDHGIGARRGVSDLDFADNECEPLIPVPFDRAGFWFTFDATVHNGVDRTDFREVQGCSVEAPLFLVRFAESEHVTSFALPSGRTRKFLEAALPCRVQFMEKLHGNIARNVSQPWKTGAQFGQFLRLIEGRWIDAITARPRVAD